VDEQRAEEIALLASEAGRMRDIVTVVLDVANLDRRMEVQLEPLALRRVVEDEAESVRRDHPSAMFEVSGGSDLVVEADERYVRRILENLLENAVKYGGTAPIGIDVREAGSGVAVAVRDYGPGIAREALPHVFERFYRQETTSGRRPGLGLGLYLSRRLADRLGGRLSVVSEPGAGAEFTLWLPFEVAEVEPQPVPPGAPKLPLRDEVPRLERLID
jgi:protein-histidine pros-kinase